MTPSSTSARRAGHCTRILAALALLLSLAAPARAQVVGGGGVVPGGGGIAGGGSIAGPLLLPDGLNTAPALAFTSEPSTGMYRNGAGAIRFAVGGVANALVIVNGAASFNGSLGIGSTLSYSNGTTLIETAANNLAQRNGTNAQIFSVGPAASTVDIQKNNAGTGYIRTTDAFSFFLGSNGINRFGVDTSGNFASNSSSGVSFTLSGPYAYATTSTDGFVASNTTAATVGATVQISPRSRWCGTAWNSVGAASETNCSVFEVLPVTNAGTTTLTQRWGQSINGGAVSYGMTLNNNNLTMASGGSIGAAGYNTLTTAGAYNVLNRGSLGAVADGAWQFTNAGLNGFTRLIFGTNDATTSGASWNLNSGVLESKTGDASAFSGIKVGAFTGAGGNLVLSTPGGKFTTYNGVTTAGVGVPVIVASANISAQTSNATITSFTTAAADSDFNVSAQMSVTASTTLATTITCTYTDVANVARTMVMPIAPLSGTFTAAGAITGAGASIWETPVMHIRVKASTTITLLTSAGTFTSVTYSASGVIRQLN